MNTHHSISRVGLCLIAMSMAVTAQPAHKITSLSVAGGEVNFNVEGPTGEYKTQCSLNLNGGWTQLSRLLSDGNPQAFNDPLNGATAKFYRLESVPAANEFHLTGEFATALTAAVAYTDLQTVFGFSFPVEEAIIPAGNSMSNASLNSRTYSAVIAALSKMAQDVSFSFPEGSRPTAAEIATAFASDLSDGNLNGNNTGTPVQIGTTGSALPAYIPQDFIDALNFVKGEIPGLYNVEFTAAAAGAPEPDQGGGPIALGGAGSFTPSTPAVWGDFYWGSSAWQ